MATKTLRETHFLQQQRSVFFLITSHCTVGSWGLKKVEAWLLLLRANDTFNGHSAKSWHGMRSVKDLTEEDR